MKIALKAAALAAAALLALPGIVAAQTTTPGVDVDLEIYDADGDGDNYICADLGVPFSAYVYVAPGSDGTTCNPGCGTAAGGTANLATGVVDVAFDPAFLAYQGHENNPATAAQDGLIQEQNLASGQVGWALAGDWVVNGNPASGLMSSCDMMKLDQAGWVVRLSFTPIQHGTSHLLLRSQPDFELSFADVCGSDFVPGSGIDEIVIATVNTQCASLIFSDGFESGNTSAWSVSIP